jgi:hypothetical protein
MKKILISIMLALCLSGFVPPPGPLPVVGKVFCTIGWYPGRRKADYINYHYVLYKGYCIRLANVPKKG